MKQNALFAIVGLVLMIGVVGFYITTFGLAVDLPLLAFFSAPVGLLFGALVLLVKK